MSLILTFLGKGGTGRTTVAIATAKKLASQGQRVLLAGQGNRPDLNLILGATLGPDPQELATNLQGVQFQTALLLERSWEQLKDLEAQYLRTPTLKEVFGQELGVLPGMDSALALNALREYDKSGKYDAIVYDGTGDQLMLRMLGMPEILSWYLRRFQNILTNSDLGRTVSPFLQPIVSAVFNVGWGEDAFSQPTSQVNNLLDEGKQAIANPHRAAAYLVTTDDPTAIATAKYLWGSAQQIGLTVGGVILNQPRVTATLTGETGSAEFAPLSVSPLPHHQGNDWQPLIDSLPDFSQADRAPKPIEIDIASRQVRLFLPGFDKKQVKLTQYGPEVTIEAGDQRRNIFLPSQLRGQPVKGAKFQNNYLTISF